MEKSISETTYSWFRIFLWLFLAGNILHNESIIMGILTTILYILLFVGAFLGIQKEILILKQKDNHLSTSAKLTKMALIAVFVLYIVVYACVGIGDLKTVI